MKASVKIVDVLVGILGVVILGAALFFVKIHHDRTPVVKRPSGVPTDAGYYQATKSWIRCLNTNDPSVFECEIYADETGELINKDTYVAPVTPSLPLVIQGSRDKVIAVHDQLGQSFNLKPKTALR